MALVTMNEMLAAELAHAAGCSAEGEIGHVAQGDETALTVVSETVDFARQTGVDALAVSIGTVHGYYKAAPKIDAELEKLNGRFLPVDKYYDPVVDACAAHAARLIRFFAGK